MRATTGRFLVSLLAMLLLAHVRERTTRDVVRAKRSCLRHARRCGMHPRRWPWIPATFQHLREVGDVRRHARSGALLVYSICGTRFRPPPSMQGYQLDGHCVRPESERRELPSSANAALRFLQPPARGMFLTRAEKNSDRGRRAYAPPRRCARSAEFDEPLDSARTRRSI